MGKRLLAIEKNCKSLHLLLFPLTMHRGQIRFGFEYCYILALLFLLNCCTYAPYAHFVMSCRLKAAVS